LNYKFADSHIISRKEIKLAKYQSVLYALANFQPLREIPRKHINEKDISSAHSLYLVAHS